MKDQSLRAESATSCDLGYSWYAVFVLMCCYTLSFVDRQILSLLVGPIKRDLGITDTQIGLLQGLAFALFYTALGLPIGRLVDTWIRRTIISIGVLFWSIATISCGFATNFWSLFGARIGVGVGEASLGPSAFSLIADYFSKGQLGTALSVYSMGIFIGSGIALAVGGLVVQSVTSVSVVHLFSFGTVASWRFAFFIVGLPGAAVAYWVSTLVEPTRRTLLRSKNGEYQAPNIVAVITQLRIRFQAFVGISVGSALQSMCLYAFYSWVPTFFIRVHKWPTGTTGVVLGCITLIAGPLGMYAGGKLCDFWHEQGIPESPLRVATASAVGVFSVFLFATTVSRVYLSVLLIFPGTFFLAMPIGSLFASLQLMFPNQVRGQVSALYVFILNFIGLTLGPLTPALFTDYVFHDGGMLGVSIAVTIAIGAILQIIVFRRSYRWYRIQLAIPSA